MTLAVVFDLDGTLIDSAPAIRDVANVMMAAYRLRRLDLAETRRLIGRGARAFCEDALKARGMVGVVDEAHRLFEEAYAAAPPEANVPYPGAVAALEALAGAGYRLALCTNKPGAATRHVLEGLGLVRFFHTVVAGDTLPLKKPDPTPLRHAVLNAGARLAVMVGDSEVDAATAKAAGVAFFLHIEGYRKGEVADIPHARAFSRFGDLPGLVNEWFAREDSILR